MKDRQNILKKLDSARLIRFSIFAAVALIHIAFLLYLRFSLPVREEEEIRDAEIIKLVDIMEYIPPPPPRIEPEKKVIVVNEQPAASEIIIEVDEEIELVSQVVETVVYVEPIYLPQHKISVIPVIPSDEVQGRIVYPPMAHRQGIEGIVYAELYIDSTGLIRKVVILKDPGHGFADAAIQALEGVRCSPAESNGTKVAVRYRYPIRFILK
ncbi:MULTISPECIES: energy transducer TonB [unclassified Oceanispirochaeta]|uniref:energy transducer TonB n=1 Tax=unclassified Oceanispirochaeta TaxID=2635722 RepID=UPI000E09629F|nr:MULTISPECIES: energy transducer TonB [unclassified Oceanispirochaeta]MBF9015077.1 energy transducer TonB [Oceanispirochaeta sp. M2]NPD71535.1 energy transducer TonB [Oceanispirochaeta sp. M1]RDG33106.1 energy transducer TonB [Oceanispirochaeta sp. M1]